MIDVPTSLIPNGTQITAAGSLALLTGLIIQFFRAWPKLAEVKVGSERALRQDLAKRVSHLEERDRRCDKLISQLRGQVIMIAHSTIELSTVVEKHDPTSPALTRARVALQKAFPLDHDPEQGGLFDLAREVEAKAEKD
jgi:hypothetical protein